MVKARRNVCSEREKYALKNRDYGGVMIVMIMITIMVMFPNRYQRNKNTSFSVRHKCINMILSKKMTVQKEV